ncbi:hypothetical protein N7468_005147 [Penicillium chermesinum]|uniref:Calcineurin-like phosphoesterase domain-containing protein n=1 Tax=Penicillium chermesinum TaxID=63820 RepID=A0A9W9TMP6_9EURO|nr:uncharacterized protein N7468_005147 [Penicillium chermesinum]KAJ5232191.1 hypothetical protein N7468_005147 [Penicillium chermesinum]
MPPSTPSSNTSGPHPQLEGDTSFPLPEFQLVPRARFHWRAVQNAITNATTATPFPLSLLDPHVVSNVTTGLWTLASEDIPRALYGVQKRIDLLGNDYYLAHIYRTLFWWTRPTHTTVLGDLIGSQWLDDAEFDRRSHRFWNRVFKGGLRVDDALTTTGAVHGPGHEAVYEKASSHLEPLGPDADPAWARRIINIAGNHDIGYAGDVSEARIARFEREFGRANWDIRFQHPPMQFGVNGTAAALRETVAPTLHLININTLVFDTPALSEEVQAQSYEYLNDLISERLYDVEDKSTFTLLLTHLPLHKKEGICTDAPYFSFHDEADKEGPEGVPRWKADGLKEQNHLSDYLSASGILQGIFGLSGDEDVPGGGFGRKGLVLTGHDHTGCDIIHFVEPSVQDNESVDLDGEANGPEKTWKWAARRYYETERFEKTPKETPSIREVTLRSMMGEFGGNAGLLSIWFDAQQGEWDYEIMMCPAGVQHIWWGVHILILITLVIGSAWTILGLVSGKPQPGKDLEKPKIGTSSGHGRSEAKKKSSKGQESVRSRSKK